MSDVTNSVPEASVLELKTVNQLNSYRFWVPSYQRGYRWTSKEVKDLLNDLWEFTNRPVKLKDEFYCLQPVVVKFRGTNEEEKEQYDVIDGQQRLTTIYILLAYLKRNDYTNNESFTISYDTRKKSEVFLKSISGVINVENPDYYCMSNAYIVIEEWFKQKTHDQALAFLIVLEIQTKVIWYEIDKSQDARDVFTRLNAGKIHLTTAELVKALFLKSDNFSNDKRSNQKQVSISQLEIAQEWDNYERALQNDQLWYFLTDEDIKTNRIEYILDLISKKEESSNADLFKDKLNPYLTFTFFYEKFYGHEYKKLQQSDIISLWSLVKNKFRIVNGWFIHKGSYDLIGYLLINNPKKKLLELSEKAMCCGKYEFKSHLEELVRGTLLNTEKDKIKELNYTDDKDKIKKILLLHNLYASKDDDYRFRFDKYKLEKWDVEHINPTTELLPENPKEQTEWLQAAAQNLDIIGFADQIQRYSSVKSVEGKQVEFDRIIKWLSDQPINGLNDNPKVEQDYFFSSDNLDNLALLDASTNRKIKNGLFVSKRMEIIDREKEGIFIPLGTKNVFLKYYNPKPETLIVWTKSDQQNYLASIQKTLNLFLNPSSQTS